MKRVLYAVAIVGLAVVAYVSLRLATTGEYKPINATIYVLLWVIPVAAVALIGILRSAKR